MTNLRSLAAVAVLGGALMAGTVFAQGPTPDGGRRGQARLGAASRAGGLPLRALNLSEAQQQQIRTLVQQHREQNRPLATRLRAARDARRKAVETIPLDEQAIRSTTHALADVQSEVAIQQAKLRADIFALLTPEQQAEANKLRAEREARRVNRQQRMQQRQPRQRG